VQLEKDALAGGLSRQVDELESITFPAVYQEPLDATQMGAAALHMGRHSAIRYLAQFTLKGPIHGTLEATDVRSGDLIYDPAHPEVRYNFSRELTRVSAEGQSTPLPVDPQLPRADWPDSIALDTTRGRLLLTSHGGNGHLYAFDLTQESWSLMRTPGLGASAITYVPDEDAIYGVNLPMSEPVLDTLRKYTADGELVREVKIVPPIVLMDRGLRGDTAQLRYAAGHAFVITPRLLKSAGPANEPSRVTLTSWIHVIKAASGEVVYEGKLAIHAGRRQLSSEQLHDLWENANLDDLDNVAWAIASAQNAAVAFLAGRFSELRSGYDAAAVDQLIAQLDDERFRVRMEASNGLKSIGRQIQPQIERHLESEDDLSGEVKARLRELIDAWQNDAPLSAQEKRDTLAVLALQRIGTQEALAVLREQAQGPNWAIRTSQAKAALAELESRE